MNMPQDHKFIRHGSISPDFFIFPGYKLVQRKAARVDGDEVVEVTYGFDMEFAEKHKQAPHFAMTCDIMTKHGKDIGGGTDHETIDRVFPELSHLIRWHLFGSYYITNSLYFAKLWWGFDKSKNMSRTAALAAFNKNVLWGRLPDEDRTLGNHMVDKLFAQAPGTMSDVDMIDWLNKYVTLWLVGRLPALRQVMFDELSAASIIVPLDGAAPKPLVVGPLNELIEPFDEVYGIHMDAVENGSTLEKHSFGTNRMDHWAITLTCEDREMKTQYSLGQGHNHRRPKIKEVLEALVSDARDYDDYKNDTLAFTQEFGYQDFAKAREAFDACHKTYDDLQELVGDEAFQAMMYELETTADNEPEKPVEYTPHTPSYREELELAATIEGLNPAQTETLLTAENMQWGDFGQHLQSWMASKMGNSFDKAMALAMWIKTGGKLDY